MVYECETHGHTLKKAVVELDEQTERTVRVTEALANRNQTYHCPNIHCRTELVPVKNHKIIVSDKPRQAHFRAKRTNPKRGTRKDINLLTLMRNEIADDLSFTEEYAAVVKRPHYHIEIKKGETWHLKKTFPVDIFAKRNGEDGIEAILHTMQFPESISMPAYYSRFKELAGPQRSSTRHGFIETSDGDIYTLSNVHQNIIVLKDQHTYKQHGRKVEYTPTFHNFIRYLTGTINYFDANFRSLQCAHLTNPQTVSKASQYGENLLFDVELTEPDYFTLLPEKPVRKVKPMKLKDGSESRSSIYIPQWRLAKPIPIEIDDDGRPVQKDLLTGQRLLYRG